VRVFFTWTGCVLVPVAGVHHHFICYVIVRSSRKDIYQQTVLVRMYYTHLTPLHLNCSVRNVERRKKFENSVTYVPRHVVKISFYPRGYVSKLLTLFSMSVTCLSTMADIV